MELKTPADQFWGFPFGVDGVMGTKEACRFFGNISRYTLDEFAKKGLIRKGKLSRKMIPICRRSAAEYLSSCEV